MSASQRFLAPQPLYLLDRPQSVAFSVVIAAHCADAPLVGQAIASALEQTSPPIEVIVSLDGSESALERALEPFHSRIEVVRGQRAGPAAARNRAINVAKGNFIAVLDADDAFTPERLAALQELASARPDLDILATDAALEVDGEVMGRFGAATSFPAEGQRAGILQACFVCAPAMRRARIQVLGGYDETLQAGEDWDLVLRLILAGCPAGLVDEPLYRYRLRRASITADRRAALAARVQVLEKATRRPGLSPAEERVLQESLRHHRRRLVRVEAELALLHDARDRRARALRLAAEPGVALRERAQALRWSVAPARAARLLAGKESGPGESAPLWKRVAR